MDGFLGFIILAIGIFNTVSPRTAWFLDVGWKFKDAEPSEEGLGLKRLGGIVMIIIGLAVMLGACS